MKHEPDIAMQARRLPDADDFARTRAMYAAGQGVEHVVIGQWLRTWDRDEFSDFPEWLQDQNG